MDHQIDSAIHHMATSHQQIARILEAKRQSAANASQLVQAIPDDHRFEGFEELVKNAGMVTQSVTAYLNSIAELEEAVASNLEHVMKQLKDTDGDE